MHAMGLDVDRVLPHELQDVLDAGGVGQASEADAVASAAGRREEGRRGEHWDGHDGRRRERGDQRSGHVAVQHLENKIGIKCEQKKVDERLNNKRSPAVDAVATVFSGTFCTMFAHGSVLP